MASIFIVEDEAFIVDLYRDILTVSGHVIAGVAYDGAEALDKYARTNPKPDVIIMDHRMPIVSGLDALKEILRLSPSQKVVFVSADLSVEAEARAIGALEFISKPFRLDDLLEKLNHLVEDGKRKLPFPERS
ncbi:MAG: hypothetical protein A3K76_02160 [Euryarchaeota archaeon RBG_13_57_23]|nr:MAG: hypothetical protein A3K76_02160 [Euryarchaeota archaeon RBG_13_57_23]